MKFVLIAASAVGIPLLAVAVIADLVGSGGESRGGHGVQPTVKLEGAVRALVKR